MKARPTPETLSLSDPTRGGHPGSDSGDSVDSGRALIWTLGEASEGGYLAAFGPSGVVSPREVGHAGMRDPGQLLADLRGRYDAFGFRPAAEDTIDHVAVETGFVAYLRLKEAYARAEGDLERAAIAAEAAEAFMADHLREVGEPMAARLDGVAEPYLARAARLLADRVGRPADAPASKIVWLQDDTMTCGEV